MTKKDHLSNEISVSGRIEENGLTGSVKSRTIAAFDRLLGNLADIPNAYLERWLKEVRAEGERKTKILDAKAQTKAEILASDERYRLTISDQVVEKEIRRHKNKSNIAFKALEYLETDAPQSEEIEDLVDDDWLNYFEAYAEKASSEKMQDLWARVLAGEIRKPGEYSLTTMRFLSELDTKIAVLFEKKMVLRLPNGYIPRPKNLKGQELLDLSFLEEVGLLQDVNGNIGLDLETGEDGKIFYRSGDLLLIFETKNNVRFNLIPITRVGRELASILPNNDLVAALEYTATEILDRVDTAEISTILEVLPNGQIRYQTIRVLKKRADTT